MARRDPAGVSEAMVIRDGEIVISGCEVLSIEICRGISFMCFVLDATTALQRRGWNHIAVHDIKI